MLLLLLVVMLVGFPQTVLRFSAGRAYRTAKHLQIPTEFVLDETGMGVHSPLESAKTDWDSFIRCRYTDKILALYRTPMLVTAVPRHSVGSDQDWNDLLALVARKIPYR